MRGSERNRYTYAIFDTRCEAIFILWYTHTPAYRRCTSLFADEINKYTTDLYLSIDTNHNKTKSLIIFIPSTLRITTLSPQRSKIPVKPHVPRTPFFYVVRTHIFLSFPLIFGKRNIHNWEPRKKCKIKVELLAFDG